MEGSNILPVNCFFLIFVSMLGIREAYCCSCLPITRREAICQSQWVSLVNLVHKNSSLADFRYIEYTVEHVKVFKSTIGEDLPTRIRTPQDLTACGVTELEVGKQYLLSGTFGSGNALMIFSCSSIPAQDGSLNLSPGVLEWDNVPKMLRSKLLSCNFPDCSSPT